MERGKKGFFTYKYGYSFFLFGEGGKCGRSEVPKASDGGTKNIAITLLFRRRKSFFADFPSFPIYFSAVSVSEESSSRM